MVIGSSHAPVALLPGQQVPAGPTVGLDIVEKGKIFFTCWDPTVA